MGLLVYTETIQQMPQNFRFLLDLVEKVKGTVENIGA
jgi:hypothetical protein